MPGKMPKTRFYLYFNIFLEWGGLPVAPLRSAVATPPRAYVLGIAVFLLCFAAIAGIMTTCQAAEAWQFLLYFSFVDLAHTGIRCAHFFCCAHVRYNRLLSLRPEETCVIPICAVLRHLGLHPYGRILHRSHREIGRKSR